ncbi:cyclin-like protein [Macrolepiota fuliginosa MF-IS2]|uniref:Cyclin-like protein n=1 Tax=Macrolepiota fuliginosa MF-IS2 TaxID=1400762 RepID=A0A9P6C0F7_9AGAR|nr:cyclin-like protein [Macrolepiota fuliginosa MF-IS2]
MYSTDGGHSRAQSPSNLGASCFRSYHPYFPPTDVDYLSSSQRGRLSHSQEEKARQTACGFLEIVGARIGFPRRTIATAQTLFHRFHLFFPRKDFNYVDVSLAALYVSTKMHDTLKKPRELLAVSYAVRYSDLAAKSKHPGGEIDLDSMDPQMVENDRQRLLAVERLILETICFNFTCRLPFPYVIKIGRALGATKSLAKLGWRLATDCHRTLLPLQYPPHTLALGSLSLACLLSTFEQAPSDSPDRVAAEEIMKRLQKKGDWERKFQSQVEDLEDIAHTLLDLMIHFAQNPSASTSPSTPSSPSPHHSGHHHHPHATQVQSPFNTDQLMRMKIAMRETEHPPRQRPSQGSIDAIYLWRPDVPNYLARNEGTVRFLFKPGGPDIS